MRFAREEKGSVLVEVSLALPLLAVVLVGAVDYGLLLQHKLRLRNAADAATAYLSIPSRTNDLAGARQLALQSIADLSGAQATAQRYWSCTPGGNRIGSDSLCSNAHTPMQWVQVDVSASGAPLVSFPGLSANSVLQFTAVERVQWMP